MGGGGVGGLVILLSFPGGVRVLPRAIWAGLRREESDGEGKGRSASSFTSLGQFIAPLASSKGRLIRVEARVVVGREVCGKKRVWYMGYGK